MDMAPNMDTAKGPVYGGVPVPMPSNTMVVSTSAPAQKQIATQTAKVQSVSDSMAQQQAARNGLAATQGFGGAANADVLAGQQADAARKAAQVQATLPKQGQVSPATNPQGLTAQQMTQKAYGLETGGANTHAPQTLNAQGQAVNAQGMTAEQMAASAGTPPAPNAPTTGGTAAAGGSTTATTGGTTATTGGTQGTQGTNQSAVTTASDQFTTDSQGILQRKDQALADYNTKVDQIRNGTYPLSPSEQAQLDTVTQQFQGLIADQKLQNQNYENGVRNAGIAAGRNMYAPEVELGNINAAISAGARQISDLNVKMVSAVTTARQAIEDRDYKLLNDQYDKLTASEDERQKVVQATYEHTKDAIDAAQKDHDNQMAERKFNFEVEQEKNKPLLEADKQLKDYLYAQMLKYSDAGVTSADTANSAMAKIQASPSFIAEQAKKAAELEQTKAQTEASYASAASSRATAAKTAGGGSGSGSSTGLGYDGLSTEAKYYFDNPSLLNGVTPTKQAAITKEFASNGVNFDAASLTKLGETQRAKIAEFDTLVSGSTDALSMLGYDEQGNKIAGAKGIDTGPYASRYQQAKQTVGMASADFTRYNSLLSNMNSQILHARSGSAVTDQEFARIKGFIPLVTDDEKTAAGKITEFNKAMDEARANYITRSTQTTQQVMDSVSKSYTVTDPKTGAIKTGSMTAAQAAEARRAGFLVN